MDDTGTLTEDEGIEAAEILGRMQPFMWMMASQFSEAELALAERSLRELENYIAPRTTLAEVFGRSAFNQTDQNITAKLPAIRACIAMIRETHSVPARSKHTIFGAELFGENT